MAMTRTDQNANFSGTHAGQHCCQLLQSAREEAGALDSAIQTVKCELRLASSPSQHELRQLLLEQHTGLWELRKSKEGQIARLLVRMTDPIQQQASAEEEEAPPQKQPSPGKFDSPPTTPDSSDIDEEALAPAAPVKAPPTLEPQVWRASKRHALQSAMLPPLKRRAGDSSPDSPISSYGHDDDYQAEEDAEALNAAVDHAATASKHGPADWQGPFPWSASKPYGLAPPPYPPPMHHEGRAYPYGSPYSPLGLNRPGAPAWPKPYPELGPVPPHIPLAPPPPVHSYF